MPVVAATAALVAVATVACVAVAVPVQVLLGCRYGCSWWRCRRCSCCRPRCHVVPLPLPLPLLLLHALPLPLVACAAAAWALVLASLTPPLPPVLCLRTRTCACLCQLQHGPDGPVATIACAACVCGCVCVGHVHGCRHWCVLRGASRRLVTAAASGAWHLCRWHRSARGWGFSDKMVFHMLHTLQHTARPP